MNLFLNTFCIIIFPVTEADLAPHPFTNLMPDSEQSRDANERVCLQEGLQTTYSSGRIEFKEEHPLSGTKLLPPPVLLLQFYNTEERWEKKTTDIFTFA